MALIDLLRNQYAFSRVVEPSFRNVDYDGDVPERWWPMSTDRMWSSIRGETSVIQF